MGVVKMWFVAALAVVWFVVATVYRWSFNYLMRMAIMPTEPMPPTTVMAAMVTVVVSVVTATLVVWYVVASAVVSGVVCGHNCVSMVIYLMRMAITPTKPMPPTT